MSGNGRRISPLRRKLRNTKDLQVKRRKTSSAIWMPGYIFPPELDLQRQSCLSSRYTSLSSTSRRLSFALQCPVSYGRYIPRWILRRTGIHQASELDYCKVITWANSSRNPLSSMASINISRIIVVMLHLRVAINGLMVPFFPSLFHYPCFWSTGDVSSY